MNWLYKGEKFNNSMIPKNAEGFVYEMQATIDGKLVKYIGKKNFYSSVKKRFGKRALAQVTDKRTKKYTVVKKESYENYYSSNKVLQEAHKAGIEIRRYMIRICFLKQNLLILKLSFSLLEEC
jgi:hypothetical protein